MKMTRRMSWQEYSNHPQVKPLIESKGLGYVRDLYLLEFKRAEFYDPQFPVMTPAQGQAQALTITGAVAEVSRFTWTAGVRNGVTGSGFNASYIEVTGYDGTTDYSLGWDNSMKHFRFYFMSGSSQTLSVPSSVDGIVTASYSLTETSNITGSLLNKWKDAVANQSATAVVAGFTNTVAPSSLFSAALGTASGSITFTHINAAAVANITTNITSGTGSVSVVTNGLDKFKFVADSPTFDTVTDNGYSGLIRVGS